MGVLGFFCDVETWLAGILSVLFLLMYLKDFAGLKVLIVAYLLFWWGFSHADNRTFEYDGLLLNAPLKNVYTVGTVVSSPVDTAHGRTKFFLEVDKITQMDGKELAPQGKTQVVLEKIHPDIWMPKMGERVEIFGDLEIAKMAKNPSQFDYARYLKSKSVFTVFYGLSEQMKPLEPPTGPKWAFFRTIDGIKLKILRTHAQWIDSPRLEIIGGMVLGDDAINAPLEVKKSFINSGTYHMLAASGMNVALIFGITFFILNKLKVGYKFSIIVGMIFVLLYVCMTGFPPSLLRAAIMLELVLLGKLIDRGANTYALLFLAAFVLLVYDPLLILDLGFKLSFIVTFGLIFMAPYACDLFSKKMPSVIADSVAVPMIAQLWVIPIQMFYFNSFATYSLVANIVILPFFSVASFLGFISFGFSLIPFVGDKICFLFSWILDFSSGCLLWISDYFSNLPNSLIMTFKPKFHQIMFYYSALVILFLALRYWSKRFLWFGLTSLLLLLISLIPIHSKNCELTFFSTGASDMILIKSPKNKYFIVDTGDLPYTSTVSQAEKILCKYMLDIGQKEVEQVVLTHYDSDHAGGVISVLEKLKVKKIIADKNPLDTILQERIEEELKKRSLRTFLPNSGETIYSENDFKLKIFYTKKYKSANERSLITLVEHKGKKILLMGDAGAKTYDTLKNQLPNNIYLLKVGHHGGKNSLSAAMLANLAPQHAIITNSNIKKRRPHRSTINLLTQANSKIHNTGTHNAITLKFTPDPQITYFENKHKF